MPQGLRLVRIVRNPDGGTNIIPVAATDTILSPTIEPLNVNQTVDNSSKIFLLYIVSLFVCCFLMLHVLWLFLCSALKSLFF